MYAVMERVFYLGFGAIGVFGMVAMGLTDFVPSPRIVALVAFSAISFGAFARYTQAAQRANTTSAVIGKET